MKKQTINVIRVTASTYADPSFKCVDEYFKEYTYPYSDESVELNVIGSCTGFEGNFDKEISFKGYIFETFTNYYNKTVDVIETGGWFDGGSKKYQDVDGNLYIRDGRINTTTLGVIYDKYPDEEGANILYIKLRVVGVECVNYPTLKDTPDYSTLFTNGVIVPRVVRPS